MAHKTIDRRGTREQNTGEACRCCGAPVVHTSQYNAPTVKCVEFLRKRISSLENELLGHKHYENTSP